MTLPQLKTLRDHIFAFKCLKKSDFNERLYMVACGARPLAMKVNCYCFQGVGTKRTPKHIECLTAREGSQVATSCARGSCALRMISHANTTNSCRQNFRQDQCMPTQKK
jgi:hypothetical protein